MTKRKGKSLNVPPAGQSWVWLTLEMMKGHAWRSAGINTRRVIDFLLIEHMQHGGQDNGRLRAPYHQLEQIGISSRLIGPAIHEGEELGLLDSCRGGRRVATTYALTWLPLSDGTPPSNRWRDYRNPRLRAWPEPKKQKGFES